MRRSRLPALTGMVICALISATCSLVAAELPNLPQLRMADFLPAIRRQVQQADAAARASPRSAVAWGKLGMVLDAYGQYESAAICYERAHALDARFFSWAYYLGTVEVHQGKYPQAVATLRTALRLEPDYLPAQLKLAESLLATGDLNGAGKIYEDILKKDGGSAEVLYGLGRLASARGETAAAADFYGRACTLFPSYGAAHYALALAARKLGETEKARQHFGLSETFKTVAPPLADPLRAEVQALNQGADPHLRHAVELGQQGRLSEAIAEEERALELDPKNVQANINLISLYARVGQPAQAEQHFEAAARLDPNRSDAYYNHGVFLFAQSKYVEAEQAFRRALEINPFYAEAHNNLGVLLERQGRTEEARAEYEACLKNQPNYRLAHYHLASILVSQKKYGPAIEHLLQTLLPDDESTPGFYYALAVAYARQGDRENALKYARSARDQATARHQSQLLVSIERDLRSLEQGTPAQ